MTKKYNPKPLKPSKTLNPESPKSTPRMRRRSIRSDEGLACPDHLSSSGMKRRVGARIFKMGGCQNQGLFWGTLNNRCRIIIMSQKGTLILTTFRICIQTRDHKISKYQGIQIAPPLGCTVDRIVPVWSLWNQNTP